MSRVLADAHRHEVLAFNSGAMGREAERLDNGVVLAI
jgi:hypothetical protein